jgi:ATP adenylyltransferase
MEPGFVDVPPTGGVSVFDHYVYPFEKGGYMRGKRPDVGCILCAIAAGKSEVPSLEILRTAKCLLSVNLYPYNSGHLIVYPLRHTADPRDLHQDEERDLSRLTRFCLDALEALYRPSGFNIGFNVGSHAGASIAHLHQHIIPRYANELGVIDLIGGAKVLIEDPNTTRERLITWFREHLSEIAEAEFPSTVRR